MIIEFGEKIFVCLQILLKKFLFRSFLQNLTIIKTVIIRMIIKIIGLKMNINTFISKVAFLLKGYTKQGSLLAKQMPKRMMCLFFTALVFAYSPA